MRRQVHRYLSGVHDWSCGNTDAYVRGLAQHRGCLGSRAFHSELEPALRQEHGEHGCRYDRRGSPMSDKDTHSESITRYEPPGTEERHGIIPAGLAVVYAAMFVWMVWYTIVFWTDKG